MLVSTKVINDSDFDDYLALAGTTASLSGAPPDMVREIANHTKQIDATVILNNGQRIQISIAKVKA